MREWEALGVLISLSCLRFSLKRKMRATRENRCMTSLLVHGRWDVYLCERDMVRQCGQGVDVCDFAEELGTVNFESTIIVFKYSAFTL